MKRMSTQRGMSILAWLVVLLVGSILITCTIKLVPVYIDHATVKAILQSAVDNPKTKNLPPSQIRKSIDRQFITNRVESIHSKEIYIKRVKGKVQINANYEQRVPLIYNIDAVVKFDDLEWELTPDSKDD